VTRVAYIDTTLRDLATYPWGSSIDANDLTVAAGALAQVGAQAIEVMDPRCARAALELRTESPWDRIRAVIRHVGRTPVGVVVHGSMLWHDRPVGADVVRQFVLSAAEAGVGRVRALDPLNDASSLEAIAAAAREVRVGFVPTLVAGPVPDVEDPRWEREAAALAALPGAMALCVSDGGGHLSPGQLATLVATATRVSDLPVEVIVQAPGGLAPILAQSAVAAGAVALYCAVGSLAMTAARPSAETLRVALSGTSNALSVDRDALHAATRVIGPMLTPDRLALAAADLFGPAVALPPDLEAALVSRLGRMGMSRSLLEVADEVRLVASDIGAATLAYPLGDAIVTQAADHVIDGERWADIEPILAATALGQFGPVRGPVSDEVLAVARAATPLDTEPVYLAGTVHDAPRGVSAEDLVLWAQFPEAVERLVARRQSLRTEVADEEGTTIDRVLLETLIQAVEGSAEAEVSVELGGARVTVRRSAPAPAVGGGAAYGGGDQAVDDGLHHVTSPMVGTFYRAPSPDADPFVSEGQRVEVGQTLCLIEAMKLFNEITADVAGIVRKVCVENAQGVEFGDLLVLIDPA
jgi:oxaloacetate decarboxylase alpha subunit